MVSINFWKHDNMKLLKHLTFAAAASTTVLAMGSAMPASAAVLVCLGAECGPTDSNVLINGGTGTTVTGVYNDNKDVEVTFTSNESLVAGANGQASIGALDSLLNQLKFTIENGFGFTSATFNLAPVPGNVPNEAVSVAINYIANGVAGQINQNIGTNGNNFLGVYGTNNEIFTSIGFVGKDGTGIGEFKQLRLGGVAAIGAVPEPAAWVMMLLGMAGVGYSMRRKEKGGLRVRFT